MVPPPPIFPTRLNLKGRTAKNSDPASPLRFFLLLESPSVTSSIILVPAMWMLCRMNPTCICTFSTSGLYQMVKGVFTYPCIRRSQTQVYPRKKVLHISAPLQPYYVLSARSNFHPKNKYFQHGQISPTVTGPGL